MYTRMHNRTYTSNSEHYNIPGVLVYTCSGECSKLAIQTIFQVCLYIHAVVNVQN